MGESEFTLLQLGMKLIKTSWKLSVAASVKQVKQKEEFVKIAINLLSKLTISVDWMMLSVYWLDKFVNISIGWLPSQLLLLFCLLLSSFYWTEEKPKSLIKILTNWKTLHQV